MSGAAGHVRNPDGTGGVVRRGPLQQQDGGVKTTSLTVKVGAVITAAGRSAQLGFGTELSSAVRRQVSKGRPGIPHGAERRGSAAVSKYHIQHCHVPKQERSSGKYLGRSVNTHTHTSIYRKYQKLKHIHGGRRQPVCTFSPIP